MKVASDAFRNRMSYEDVNNHLTNGDDLYLVKDDSDLVGFALFSHLGEILYLNGMAVKEEYQGRGLFYEIVEEELQNGFSYFSLRTQNPVMYNAVKNLKDKKLLNEVHPVDGFEVPNGLERVLTQVSEYLNRDYRKLYKKGNYGSCLYGRKYSYEDKHLEDLFPEFNSDRGDALIVIGVK